MLKARMSWKEQLLVWRQHWNSLLMRNTLWMLMGEGVKLVLQMAYFVIIARTLGAHGYGLFMGVVTLVAIMAPFSSLGRGELLVMNVSRDKTVFREYLGNALLMTLISGIVLTAVTVTLGRLFLPDTINPLVILWVALSDLICYRVFNISGQSYQAFERLKRTAQLNMLMGGVRLSGAATLAWMNTEQNIELWGFLYLMTTLVMMLAALILVIKELGRPVMNIRKLIREVKEGAYFSISMSSLVVYSDIGKTMLVRYGSADHAGIYAAASRIVDVALTPIYSLMSASFSRFFQEGKNGIARSVGYAKRLIPFALIYAAIAWLILYLMAPILPWILGEDYLFAVEAIRWMAVVPLFKGIHIFAADALTGAGFQGWRSSIQVMVAVIVAVLHMLIVPLYSWKGAIVVSIVGDIMLCCCYWLIIGYLLRRERVVRMEGQLTHEEAKLAQWSDR
ncbi:polysaccharide biosynthesis protein [Brevibacillus invocatus]|uniref:Polysaccharide biosynthesis protein n=2 Tax=Brevibacillus TaxID=55080 RepID=A0A3M8CH25_9BACL|nr:polysaccharide biosynthesis protein [Brevibacillus invocatus]